MDVNTVPMQIESFEDNYCDPDFKWLTSSPCPKQLKHYKATIQGGSWLWDLEYDAEEFCLAGETYTKENHWSKELGTPFFPFKYITQQTILCQYYKKKQKNYNTKYKGKPTRGPNFLVNSGTATEEENLDNLMEA